MHRILVLRGGALGDFIVTLPALAALRSRWPQARIELAGNATTASIALRRGLLDAVHSQHEARWSALFSTEPLPADFRSWLERFDLVLNYWPDADSELSRHFPLHPQQRFLSTAALPDTGPAATHYFSPLLSLGLTAGDLCYGLSAHKSGRTIAIHPGSGSARKNWPLTHWVELARWLRETHRAELLIVTGEVESLEVQTSLAPYGRLAHAWPLEELIAAFASCRLFIGHDSGVSHLAASCGVPSLLLFGPTDPAIWAPPAPHVHVLQNGPTLDAISVADVQRALSGSL